MGYHVTVESFRAAAGKPVRIRADIRAGLEFIADVDAWRRIEQDALGPPGNRAQLNDLATAQAPAW